MYNLQVVNCKLTTTIIIMEHYGQRGKLLTDGTFKRFEPYKVSKTVTTKHSKTFLGFKVPGTEWTTSRVVTETKVRETDMGNKIDPKAQTP
jgi:hypothetical protein